MILIHWNQKLKKLSKLSEPIKRSLSRKIMIFVSTFMVSFIIIYSSYYYKNTRLIGGGYICDADTCKSLIMNPHPYQPSDKNIIYSAGIINTLLKNKIEIHSAAAIDFKNLMEENAFSQYLGKFNDKALDGINEDVQYKFPQHPPLQFPKIKEGNQLLFSYVFKNLKLPNYLGIADNDFDFKGKKIKFIQYFPSYDKKQSGHLYRTKDSGNYLFTLNLEDGSTAYWYTAIGTPDMITAWKDGQYLIQNSVPLNLMPNEYVLFPEIDLSVIKHYTKDELNTYFAPSANNFDYIEDRIKLKTSADPVSKKSTIDPKTSVIMNKKCFFALKTKQGVFPYIALMINNPEILKH